MSNCNGLLPVGFGNYINSHKIVSVGTYSSAPTKRAVREAAANNMIIDLTAGKKCKSVIYMDSEHIILAAISPETINLRNNSGNNSNNQPQ